MEDKLIFCTLFDKNYLSRGLVLYDSLKSNCKNFHLYIFAFDKVCFAILNNLKLPNITTISLLEFEDSKLLAVKDERSIAEYCWTCTASTVWYVLNNFQVSHCTYLDADMFFYSDPSVLINELKTQSVLITEHRYSNPGELEMLAGIYNVQFVCFKNNEEGRKACLWWREACIEWCYDRFEDGKFGDQKYLDDWPTRFPFVHVLKHEGGGLATWNIQQYSIETGINGELLVKNLKSKNVFPIVFYHFHALKFFKHDILSLSPDELSTSVINLIYFPYVRLLLKRSQFINRLDSSFNPNGVFSKSPQMPLSLRDKLYIFRTEVFSELFKLNFTLFFQKWTKLSQKFKRHNYYYLQQIRP
jgi:hypothetical protein